MTETLAGAEDTTPTNGTTAAARPVLVTEPTVEVAPVPKRRGRPPKVKVEGSTEPKQTRKRPTAENIAQLKAWKAEGRTLAEIKELSGFSIGSIRKYAPDATKPTKAPAAKAAAPKLGRPPKAQAAAPAPSKLDTATQLKAALFDLIRDGHPIAAIRGALASFPV